MIEMLSERMRHIAKRAGFGEPAPPVLWAIALVMVAAAVWAVWHWWPADGDGEVTFEPAPQEITAPPQPPAEIVSQPDTATLWVHVVGCVRHPGVYELKTGSRVVDAVDAAGGTLPDAVQASVNMARYVTDGEQVFVPDEDDPDATSGAASSGGGASVGGAVVPGDPLVDLNSADAASLDTLPGVGPSTASKIVADRETNGPFASVDDLTRVAGIGPKKLEQIKSLACVR